MHRSLVLMLRFLIPLESCSGEGGVYFAIGPEAHLDAAVARIEVGDSGVQRCVSEGCGPKDEAGFHSEITTCCPLDP